MIQEDCACINECMFVGWKYLSKISILQFLLQMDKGKAQYLRYLTEDKTSRSSQAAKNIQRN